MISYLDYVLRDSNCNAILYKDFMVKVNRIVKSEAVHFVRIIEVV